MSEVEAPVAPAGDTAGAMLRRAREAAGLHVASLAVALKVPVRKLEALEQDRYELLSDAVFVRGLASAVCRNLKIDPQPVLERLPRSDKPRLMQDNEGINTPFRSPADGPKPAWFEQLSRPVTLSVVAILLAAVVVLFLPRLQLEGNVASSSQPDPVMPPPSAVVVPEGSSPAATPEVATQGNPPPSNEASASKAPPAPAPAPSIAPLPSSAGVPASAPAGSIALRASPGVAGAPSQQPAPAIAPAPAAPPAATPTTAAVAAPAPAADGAAVSGIVVFRTRGNSWIQVTDARGTPVLRKLMEPGESAAASGALPLNVTVGSAESTEVQVRGKPFNLAPVSRDNVARFEVK